MLIFHQNLKNFDGKKNMGDGRCEILHDIKIEMNKFESELMNTKEN
jgi:hypothetical protein